MAGCWNGTLVLFCRYCNEFYGCNCGKYSPRQKDIVPFSNIAGHKTHFGPHNTQCVFIDSPWFACLSGGTSSNSLPSVSLLPALFFPFITWNILVGISIKCIYPRCCANCCSNSSGWFLGYSYFL